jgi:secretion/DNA translocation related CpaE-like protein
VDADRFGGGIDLLLGAEQLPGTRWPDLVGARRSADVAALAESLPTVHGLRVLAVGRHDTRLEVDAMAPVLTAVRMLPGPVVVDLPSRLDAAAEIAVTACTSLVVVVRAEVRAAAAAAVLAEVARQLTHDVCLVVRRAPHSQLRAADVAAAVGLPLVATYESDPALAAAADDGRLTQLRRPGAIAAVADEILDRLAAAAASP